MSSPLFARTVTCASLDDARRREMLALMRVCYDGVMPERFASDLDDKQFVILLFAKAGRALVGFSTLKVREERLGGRTVELVFSGDTVIHPDYWGAKSLQAAFGHFLLARKLRRPWRPCLWLLLSGGYKTYLMMTNNFPRSFPSRRGEPSPVRRAFLERIAREWFGSQYDAARGVVRFASPHYRVRDGIAPLDAVTAARPDVAFYLARNLGHAEGDELACLAEIRLRDLVTALTRIVLIQARLARHRAAASPQASRAGALR